MLTRELYRKIKAMDRTEMEAYMSNLYNQGYNAGISAISKEIAERVDTGIRNTEGIGEKRYQALIENINKELTRDTIQEGDNEAKDQV